MSNQLNQVRNVPSVFFASEREIPVTHIQTGKEKMTSVLEAKGANRVVVDVTRVKTIPTALELLEFAENLCLDLARNARLGLVIRLDQARRANIVRMIARNRGAFPGVFFDVEDAEAWVNQANLLPQRRAQ